AHYRVWSGKLDPNGPRAGAINGTLNETSQEFFKVANERVLPKLRTGVPADREAAKAVVKGTLNRIYERHLQGVEEGVRACDAVIAKTVEEIEATIRYWTTVQILFGIIGLALIGGLGWWLARGIVKPTGLLLERVHDMSRGEADLTKRVTIDSQDEIGRLA